MGLCLGTNLDSKKELKNKTYENTKELNFSGRTIEAKIVKVYDGDTCWAVFHHDGEYYRHKIRLAGIDAPEMRPALSIKDHKRELEKEKERAERAKKELERLILDKIVTIRCRQDDKYGRILGVILVDNINVNEHMVDKGYAVKYMQAK